jgi:hypothetical protein
MLLGPFLPLVANATEEETDPPADPSSVNQGVGRWTGLTAVSSPRLPPAALGPAGILRQPRDPVPWVFHSPSSKEPPAALRCGDRALCSWTDFDYVSSRPGTARTPG